MILAIYGPQNANITFYFILFKFLGDFLTLTIQSSLPLLEVESQRHCSDTPPLSELF